jgi:hypothetical protein
VETKIALLELENSSDKGKINQFWLKYILMVDDNLVQK